MLLLGASLVACAPAASAPPAKPAAEKLHGKAQRLEADGRIGVYTSIPWGFRTASYWIEGPKGLIVIDTQFLPSASAEVIEQAESITGKKVELAIVLHPNPDKFNGTATFQARGIRVVTSAQVLAKIPEVHAQRVDSFYARYKPDYPKELPKPESFGDKDGELSAGGVTVKTHLLGPGCSAAHVVVEYDVFLDVGLEEVWRKQAAKAAGR
jgi:glyoxylase-like metal-dependent hydrolase (beta-lactamase superfamily II)